MKYDPRRVFWADDGRAFVLTYQQVKGVRTKRRVYGDVKICEGCKSRFFTRPHPIPVRFCSHSCEKRGERNPMRRQQAARETIAKTTADKWFARIIRARRWCQKCGADGADPSTFLQCAHIYSRTYLGIRWDERNAMALCRRCHMFFTHRPIEWEEFVIAEIGEALYRELRVIAMLPAKPDSKDLLDRLLDRLGTLCLDAP